MHQEVSAKGHGGIVLLWKPKLLSILGNQTLNIMTTALLRATTKFKKELKRMLNSLQYCVSGAITLSMSNSLGHLLHVGRC